MTGSGSLCRPGIATGWLSFLQGFRPADTQSLELLSLPRTFQKLETSLADCPVHYGPGQATRAEQLVASNLRGGAVDNPSFPAPGPQYPPLLA